jgi:hypothetical protein
MHFFTREESERFPDLLFEYAKPGAYVYVSAMAPWKEAYQFYQQQKRKLERYPGYMTRVSQAKLGTTSLTHIEFIPTPAERRPGEVWAEPRKLLQFNPLHFFDIDQLRSLFGRFEVVDTHYFSLGLKEALRKDPPIDRNIAYNACIILRKPLL